MDQSTLGIMEIVGPALLLIALLVLVLRRGSSGKTNRSEQGARDVYKQEEQRRQDGTDNL